MIKVAQEPFDVDQLAYLLVELDQIHHEADPDRFPLYSLEKRKEEILSIFKEGNLFYVENQSQMLGFAAVINHGSALVIKYLFIQPEYRRGKLATQLVKEIFSKFPGKEILATVYVFNSDAVKFYEKMFELSALVFKFRSENDEAKDVTLTGYH